MEQQGPNSSSTPAYTKQNEMTQLMDEIAAHNRSRGAVVTRGFRPTQPVGPRVQTAAMQIAPDGIIPPVPMRDPRTGELSMPPEVPAPTVGMIVPTMGTRQGLPDFRKVQSINLERNVLLVDGMEFELPPEDVQEIKLYVVHAITDAITKKVAQALVAFQQEVELAKQQATAGLAVQPLGEGAGKEPTVLPVREGEASSGTSDERTEADSVRTDETPSPTLVSNLGESVQPVQHLRNLPPSAPANVVPRARRARQKPAANLGSHRARKQQPA